MVRPKKFGEKSIAITCRIPERYLHLIRNENLNVGTFLTHRLQERYERVEKAEIFYDGWADPDILEKLARLWGQLQKYFNMYRGAHEFGNDEYAPRTWGPNNQEVDHTIEILTEGKVHVTRGWLVRHYQKIKEKAGDLGTR